MAEGVARDRRIHDRDWLAAHLGEERRRSDLLAEIREAIFGAQDGIVSILTVVSTLGGATSDNHLVLLGGIATTVAEVFSMAAGEYMGSKSQHEVFEAQIEAEREEVRDRPDEAKAEVAFMLEREGLDSASARRAADDIASNPEVLLRTMVEKELGLSAESDVKPIRGAVILSGALAIAALIPLVPYMFFSARAALVISIVASGIALFALGVVKSRWTRGNPIRAGLEIVSLAAIAGVGGYLVGTLLPELVESIRP